MGIHQNGRARAAKSFLLVGAASLALASAAKAQTQHTFAIPAQDATASLQAYAKQSGKQVLFPYDAVAGKKTPEIRGAFSDAEALARLAAAAGLVVTSDDGRTVTLQARPVGGDPQVKDAPPAVQVSSVSAQTVATAGSDHEVVPRELVVTATRVTRPGYTSPTPVTTVNTADLQVGGRMLLSEVLNDLPSERTTANSSAYGTGTNQYNYIDLRGLGPQRTLVLVDGQRPVLTGSSTSIYFDLDSVPTSLIKRVDVVTGGASATWGSDAVAGVVNIILDTNFTGARASAEYGATTEGRGSSYKVDFGIGSKFGPDDRGHFIIGGQIQETGQISNRYSNPTIAYGMISNPAYTPTNGQPQQLLVNNLNFSIASTGGLITGGPLAGTNFLGGGATAPFVYGQYRGSTYMAGGDPTAGYLNKYATLQVPADNKSIYTNATYDLTSDIKLKSSLHWSHHSSSDDLFDDYNLGNITIQSTNAYLPASVASAMAAAHVTSFPLGRLNTDLPLLHNDITSDNLQGSFGAEGKFGSNWTWDAFYSYGQDRTHEVLSGEKYKDLFAQSVDSIISPTTGLPICRVALTVPTTACVPVNLFGFGSPSKAAINYFEGASSYNSLSAQNELSANLHGQPFSTWAGPVSVAAGGEYRRESVNEQADPQSLAGRFDLLNYANLRGSYSAEEGYAEVVAPIVRDLPLLNLVEVNSGVRVSNYSNNVGTLTSWKAGLTDDVFGDLKLRASYSQDQRAPGLGDLYAQQTTTVGQILDPRNNTSVSAFIYGGGNPSLKAETATTKTFGGVYQPKWLPGFEASLDYYKINIAGAIGQLTGQTIVTRCLTGQDTRFCSDIVQNAQNVITTVYSRNLNLSGYDVSGLDFEMNDILPLGKLNEALPGSLNSRFLLSYLAKYSITDGVNVSECAGVVGASSSCPNPRFKASLNEIYSINSYRLNVRVRYISSGVFSNTITNNDNNVPAKTYVDIGVNYKLPMRSDLEIYGNVNNIFNTQSPLDPNPALYDIIGRTFNVGVRASF